MTVQNYRQNWCSI